MLPPSLLTTRLRSILTTVVGTLQISLDALIGVNSTQNHRIAKIKKIHEDADIFGSISDSSFDKDDTIPKSSTLALGRGKLAGEGNERKND